MRRSVLFLNLLLVAAIGLSCWRMYGQYRETLKRQQEFLARRFPAPPPPILTLPPDPPPVQASSYIEIAATLPFSPDRNPTVVVEETPPKPMPPLPAYYGMMNFGQGPRVILSTANVPQRSYQVGETIGEFKLLAVAQSGLVFEWDGKQVPASYAELMRNAASAAPAAGPQQGAPSPAGSPPAPSQANRSSAAAVVSVAGGASAGAASGEMGAADSQGVRECKAGDTSPEGAIVNGFRKVTTRSPFGAICRWIPVK